MITVYVSGVGVHGPGLVGWESSRVIFAEEESYKELEFHPPQPNLLPPTERRRASATISLGVSVGHEALVQSGMQAQEPATVFASSEGDSEIVDYLCSSLAQSEKAVSPTRFHNSVHNAPAGYWHIATHTHAPSNSISCYDASFACGLLDAATQAVIDRRVVLLCVYDIAMPDTLKEKRLIEYSFGMALILSNQPCKQSFARLDIDLTELTGNAETTLADQKLEMLRMDNPAARSLPLLVAIARGDKEVCLTYVGGNCLKVGVSSQ